MKKSTLLLSIVLSLNLLASDNSYDIWSYLLKPHKSDEKLRELAIEKGLKAVPKSLETLRDVIKDSDLSLSKIKLGKLLFNDTILSLNRDISCASCHNLSTGGDDNIATAIGNDGLQNPNHINTPTVLNVALAKDFFWDGRSKSLKEQAKGPIEAHFEMAMTPKLVEERLNSSNYTVLFKEVYETNYITFDFVLSAISTYEKTLLTRGRFDEFLEGDLYALTKNEEDGLELFIKKGCVLCHSDMGLGGGYMRKFPLRRHSIWSMIGAKETKKLLKEYSKVLMFMEERVQTKERYKTLIEHLGKERVKLILDGFFEYYEPQKRKEVIVTTACKSCHNNILEESKLKSIAYPFKNSGEFLGKGDGRSSRYFRVPILRNISKTAPYYHNGEVKRLEDAVKLMGQHQLGQNFTDIEIKKIVEFLKSLDGELVDYISN